MLNTAILRKPTRSILKQKSFISRYSKFRILFQYEPFRLSYLSIDTFINLRLNIQKMKKIRYTKIH